MSSFFTVPASQRKRKRAEPRTTRPSKRRTTEQDADAPGTRNRRQIRDQDAEADSEISGSDSESSLPLEEPLSDSEATSEEDEHPDDRRARLAQRYLDNIREEVDDTGFDAQEVDKDLIAQRLRDDVDEAKGRQYRLIAETLDWSAASHTAFRGVQTQTTTGVAICPPYVYTVSKDKYLVKWELNDPNVEKTRSTDGEDRTEKQGQRPKQLDYVRGVRIDASQRQQHGHTAPILTVAASPNGLYVATGGADKKLIIWAAASLKPLKTFTTHRDTVTSLFFSPQLASSSSSQQQDSQLFSASLDRTIKTYSLDPSGASLAYIETLFGHQDHVVDVTAMSLDQAVSVGSRDRTARLWRVVEETQLVFRADSHPKHETFSAGSVDCVAALPPSHFVTGSDSGAINLWTIHKKKPLFTVPAAHGLELPPPIEEVTSETASEMVAQLKIDDRRRPLPRAITALASLSGTDIIVSGSWDGWIRIWKVSDDKKSLLPLGTVGNGNKTTQNASEASTDNDGKNGIQIKALNEMEHQNGNGTAYDGHVGEEAPIRGIINSLALFERRKVLTHQFGSKRHGDTLGLCIVATTGKEPRLGRWRKFDHGKNGATVFEVQTTSKP